MDINEYKTRTIPKYYSFMYLDGYSPNEILYARREDILDQIDEKKELSNTINLIINGVVNNG